MSCGDIEGALRYTVSLMTTRTITSRSTPLAGAPALLAVLAILVAAPAMTGAPVASGQVGLSFARAVSVAGIGHLFVQAASPDRFIYSDGMLPEGTGGIVRGLHGNPAVQRLGPLRPGLPPPHTC